MHTLIVGRTMSGKSALAKQIGSELRLKKVEVIAFNPTNEKGYTEKDAFGCAAAEWETDNADEFADEVERRINSETKKRVLIIDEAHEYFPHGGSENTWIGTRGRHYGLTVIAISQRGALINPTFRTQCSKIYLLPCSRLDAKFMSDEYDSDELRQATRQKPGEYMVVDVKTFNVEKGFVF